MAAVPKTDGKREEVLHRPVLTKSEGVEMLESGEGVVKYSGQVPLRVGGVTTFRLYRMFLEVCDILFLQVLRLTVLFAVLPDGGVYSSESTDTLDTGPGDHCQYSSIDSTIACLYSRLRAIHIRVPECSM